MPWMNLTDNVDWKKPDTKYNVLCNSIHMKFKNQQNECVITEVQTVVAFGKGDIAREGWENLLGC